MAVQNVLGVVIFAVVSKILYMISLPIYRKLLPVVVTIISTIYFCIKAVTDAILGFFRAIAQTIRDICALFGKLFMMLVALSTVIGLIALTYWWTWMGISVTAGGLVTYGSIKGWRLILQLAKKMGAKIYAFMMWLRRLSTKASIYVFYTPFIRWFLPIVILGSWVVVAALGSISFIDSNVAGADIREKLTVLLVSLMEKLKETGFGKFKDAADSGSGPDFKDMVNKGLDEFHANSKSALYWTTIGSFLASISLMVLTPFAPYAGFSKTPSDYESLPNTQFGGGQTVKSKCSDPKYERMNFKQVVSSQVTLSGLAAARLMFPAVTLLITIWGKMLKFFRQVESSNDELATEITEQNPGIEDLIVGKIAGPGSDAPGDRHCFLPLTPQNSRSGYKPSQPYVSSRHDSGNEAAADEDRTATRAIESLKESVTGTIPKDKTKKKPLRWPTTGPRRREHPHQKGQKEEKKTQEENLLDRQGWENCEKAPRRTRSRGKS